MAKKIILKGVAASAGQAVGLVKVITDPKEFKKFQEGMILVAKITDPEWLAVMVKAVAVVTNEGGLLSHPAIVCREFGIPAIVGTVKATKVLRDGQKVIIDGTKGSVYEE